MSRPDWAGFWKAMIVVVWICGISIWGSIIQANNYKKSKPELKVPRLYDFMKDGTVVYFIEEKAVKEGMVRYIVPGQVQIETALTNDTYPLEDVFFDRDAATDELIERISKELRN